MFDDLFLCFVKLADGWLLFRACDAELVREQAVCPFGTSAMRIPDREVGNVSGYL